LPYTPLCPGTHISLTLFCSVLPVQVDENSSKPI
jgi:hypothetical protein